MRSDTIPAIGLAIGAALGMAGTFVASDALRETLWAIDGVALVVAAALLTLKYQRLGMTSPRPASLSSSPAKACFWPAMRRGCRPAFLPILAASRCGRPRSC